MARNTKVLRNGAVLLGVGALLAAAATPGAVAQSTGTEEASAAITRALLTQADASNKEIERQLLVTQIQVDGSGQISFDVPVVEGAAPKNMDGFGGPTVENGQAVYNIDASGPQTFRTQQDGSGVKVPVKLTVKAKLNGKPIDPTELSNVTGDVELAYTAENLTSTPTTLFYENGNGDPIEEEIDIKTGMGGTLDITFPPTWSNFVSEDVEVISGDGSGETLVSGGFTLMEPFGEPTGTITIKAKVTNGSMPPAVLQFLLLEPKNNPTARALSESLKGGAASGQQIYAGGAALDEGASLLIEGLTTAVDGAGQLAAGINDQLQPGLAETLVGELKNLPATVRAQPDFETVTGGFDTLNSAVGGVKDKLGVFSSTGAGQYLKSDGTIDKGRTDVARTVWALIYGVRAQDTPAGSAKNADGSLVLPSESTGGLTNPTCDSSTPDGILSKTNPCGAFQIAQKIIAATSGSQTALDGPIKSGFTQALNALGCTRGRGSWSCTEATANAPLNAAWNGIYGLPNGVSINLFGATVLGSGLLPKLTTDPNGIPDPNTNNGNTATGILNELRGALALGGVGANGVPGKCEGYKTPGDAASGLNLNATTEQVENTCSGADVLNVALLVSNELETGVSTTLLEGISDSLIEGVQPLIDGANLLADGSSQLADGLPAALDGVKTIKSDGAASLLESGGAAAEDYGRQVALYEAMNNPDLVSKYIPGGAPTGEDIVYNGVYKYELSGVGSQGTSTGTNLALGALGLLAAIGAGAFAASRRKA